MTALPPELAAMTREDRINLVGEYLARCVLEATPRMQPPLPDKPVVALGNVAQRIAACLATDGAALGEVGKITIGLNGAKTTITVEMERRTAD